MKLSPRYDSSSIIEISGTAADQAEPVRRQRRRMEALLQALDDNAWKTPSRCDGWNVQDVIAHLVGVNRFWESSITAGLAGAPTRILAEFDPAAHPPRMIEPMRALRPSEVLDQFVASNDGFLGVLDKLDDDGWMTTVETPAGHVSVRLLAFHAIWDAWIHERDVALPLGMTPAEEPDEVASSLRYAAGIGPALDATEGRPSAGVVGVAGTAPEVSFTVTVGDSVVISDEPAPADVPCLRGPSAELVEALSIRAPLPPDAPREWHLLRRSLATMFDVQNEAES